MHTARRLWPGCAAIPLNAEYTYSSQAYDAAYGIPGSVPRPPYLLLYPRFDELIARYRFINRWDQVRFCFSTSHAVYLLAVQLPSIGCNQLPCFG